MISLLNPGFGFRIGKYTTCANYCSLIHPSLFESWFVWGNAKACAGKNLEREESLPLPLGCQAKAELAAALWRSFQTCCLFVSGHPN
jgi:hypothetical protein